MSETRAQARRLMEVLEESEDIISRKLDEAERCARLIKICDCPRQKRIMELEQEQRLFDIRTSREVLSELRTECRKISRRIL